MPVELGLEKLLKGVRRHRREIGREFSRILEVVVEEREDEILDFSRQIIPLEVQKWNSTEVAQWIAASYYANAEYLDYAPQNPSPLQFNVFIANEDQPLEASFIWREKPPRIDVTANCDKNFLQYIISETMHAAHFDLLKSMGVNLRKSARHTLYTLTEVLDDANPVYVVRTISDNGDPYLFDFNLLNDDNGHPSSNYLRIRLNPNAKTRRMQLKWLARQVPRKAESGDHGWDCFVYQRHLEGRLVNPPDAALVPEKFYGGGRVEPHFRRAREDFIETLPFEVSEEDTVRIGKRKVRTFASQIDYIALSLSTKHPAELLERIKYA